MKIIVRDLTKLERLDDDDAINAFIREYRNKIGKVAYVSDAIYTVTELCAKHNIDYAEAFINEYDETRVQLIVNNSAIAFDENTIYNNIMNGEFDNAKSQLHNIEKAIDDLNNGDYAFILLRGPIIK